MVDTIGTRGKTKKGLCWNNIEHVKEVTDTSTGLTLLKGKIKNLYINETIDSFYVNGSMSKFYLDNNLESLTRKTMKEAIEKLSDILKVKIDNSILYRFDISQNMIMNENVQKYCNCLGELSRFKKANFNKSIYYNTNLIQLIFYDKLAEMSKKRQAIPEEFKQYKGRVLRYEMRYLRNLKKVFGKDVLLSDLAEENFYIQLVENWKSYYFKIEKILKLKLQDIAFKNIKTFQEALMIEGLKSLGYEQAEKLIELSDSKLSYRQKNRAKEFINGLKQSKDLTEINPLIQELDKKIIQSTLYYR